MGAQNLLDEWQTVQNLVCDVWSESKRFAHVCLPNGKYGRRQESIDSPTSPLKL